MMQAHNGAGLQVRPAQLNDLMSIAAWLSAVPGHSWRGDDLQQSLQAANRDVWVAHKAGDSNACGFVIVQRILDESSILFMAVEPRQRRSGVASALLEALQEQSVSQGCQRIVLEVRESNHPAQQLYRKHRFELVGERPNYYACLAPQQGREKALLLAWQPPR